MSTTSPLVYVVDDDQSMLESVRWLIESVGLLVKTFSNANAFLEAYNPSHAGCLILDVRMPELSGLELQQALRRRNINIPIIFVTGHGDVPMAIRAMKAGAVEFLTKPFNDQALLDSISHAIKKDQSARVARKQLDEIAARLHRLTPRENQVMRLVVAGKLNKIIASELNISSKTVELHRAKIMDKMEAGSLAELVRLVMLHQSSAAPQEVLA